MSGTWFDTLKKNFAHVNTNDGLAEVTTTGADGTATTEKVRNGTVEGVNTLEFLEASESLVTLFDLLGSAAFTIVKNDMNGNIAKIRTRYNNAVAQSHTLEELVLAERADKKKEATEGLLWLLRGLDFTAQAIRHNAVNGQVELTDSFAKAYEATLKKHHGFIVKGAFSVALKATPYRKDFELKLASNDPSKVPELPAQRDEWLGNLEKVVSQMQTFYSKNPQTKF